MHIVSTEFVCHKPWAHCSSSIGNVSLLKKQTNKQTKHFPWMFFKLGKNITQTISVSRIFSPVLHKGIKRVYTACDSTNLDTLGHLSIRVSPYGLNNLCYISEPYKQSKELIILWQTQHYFPPPYNFTVLLGAPYPGVTTITRSRLPLAESLACRRRWLDKVVVSDSCKTETIKKTKLREKSSLMKDQG